MKWCLVVPIFIGLARADNSFDPVYSIFNCPELNSQEEIDLDKVMGKWYVVEVLKHNIDSLKSLSGSYVVDSCPIVQLRPFEYSSLKLLWTEKAGNIEYTFRIPDISRRPGFWLSTSLQNGTMVEREYSQFTGSVHVMKAVASDMVLSFCSRSPDDQLYSILLAREHILQKSDKQGVHNLLRRRGLKIGIIQETCINGTVWRGEPFGLVVWTALIGLLSSSILFIPWQQ